jgi:polyferredoxin
MAGDSIIQAQARLTHGATSAPQAGTASPAVKVTFIRRRPDQAQFARRTVQVLFLLLNLWIGARFYFFVRYYETGGLTAWVPRPPGVEGWLPIAALMNLKYFLVTGLVPEVHAAGLFLLMAFLTITFVARKAFCSWLCPVGTVSEWLWQGGREVFGRTWAAPRWLDLPLRGLKYLLMGFFVYAVLGMSAGDIRAFIHSPYGQVADVKMMNFFRDLGPTAAVVIGVLVVGSVAVKNLWCRYLCPYGALLGLVSLVSPTWIRREADACIDCAKCAKACPSLLPVDRLVTVKSAECTGCLECVTVCPAQGALRLSVGRSPAIPTWGVAAAIAVIFFGFVGYAHLAGHWHTPVPDEVYRALIPNANAFGHPQ